MIRPDELLQIRNRDARMAVLKEREPRVILGPMDGDLAHGDRGMLLSHVDSLQRVPDTKAWCAKNSHMLEVLSPLDIVIAWEEFRARSQADGRAEHE